MADITMRNNLLFKIRKIIGLLILICWPATHATGLHTLSEGEAKQLAKAFYAAQGEWAGKFEIARFIKSRFEVKQNGAVRSHFEYEWAFIKDPSRRGIDKRYFDYQWINNGWRVVEMGQHLSGQP